MFRVGSAALIAMAFLSACGGGRGAGQSSLPALAGGADTKLRPVAAPEASGDVVAINAGGGAAGGFAADKDYANSSWIYKTASAIDTSGVSDPAPQAVYADEREGATVAYTIPGLTAGAAYTVKLSFAELWWTAAGQRVFNIGINNATVVNNFDIFKTAGARFKAVAKSFTAAATSSGTIAITLTAVTNYAAVDAVEISPATGTATPAPTATPTTPPGSTSFVDWSTYGYDSGHTGFNPYTTGITPASILKLHLAWQTATQGSQTQPIVATNIAGHTALLIVGSYNNARAYDALTGKLAWQTTLPKQDVQACGSAGISGTAAYDKSLGAVFVVAGNGGGAPNHILLYRLDAATGRITGEVDVTPSLEPGEANDSHAGVLFANGRVYVGTGSDCEGSATIKYPSWRGRVVSVNPGSMTISSTFFTTWGHGGNFGGGGVWAWGGVSADAGGNIYVATGNAETNLTTGASKITPPFEATNDEQAGYAEHLVKLNADLTTVEGSNYPGFNFKIGYDDLDYTGSPVIYTPPLGSGCGTLSATQGKGGTLVINNTSTMAVRDSFALSVPSARAYYVGNPAFSPNTGYLYAAITSSGAGSSLLPPGLAAIGDCGSSLVWHAQFGQDSTLFRGDEQRSAPTVTAGGVVFIGTPCTSNGSGGCGTPGTANGAVWAIDAKSGAVLGGGKPVLITGDNIRMAPSADGLWVFVYDNSGNFYGLTVDSSVKAVPAQAARRLEPMFHVHG